MNTKPTRTGPKEVTWNYEKIEDLASIGLTQEECAMALGVHSSTWYLHIQKGNTEISEAYQRGKAKHCEEVFRGLSKAAKGGDKQAAIFLAKAHFNRRENINLLVSGDPDNPIKHEHAKLSPEERKARLAALEKKKEAFNAAEKPRGPGPEAGSEGPETNQPAAGSPDQ